MKTTNSSKLSEKNFATLAAAMKAVMDGERKKKQQMPNQEIRQALKEKGLHLYDLAKASGYAESTISNKLRNELEPHEAQMYLSVIQKNGSQNSTAIKAKAGAGYQRGLEAGHAMLPLR